MVERIKRLDTTQVLWIRWKTSQLTTQRQPSHDSVWLEATVSTNPSQVRCSNLTWHACTLLRKTYFWGKQHGSKFRARHICSYSIIFSYIVPFTSIFNISPNWAPKIKRSGLRKKQHFSEDFDPFFAARRCEAAVTCAKSSWKDSTWNWSRNDGGSQRRDLSSILDPYPCDDFGYLNWNVWNLKFGR